MVSGVEAVATVTSIQPPMEEREPSGQPLSPAGRQAAADLQGIYQAIVELAGDLILVLDASGQVTYANPCTEQTLQVPRDALAGRLLSAFVVPDCRERLQSALAEAERTGSSLCEFVLRAADGRYVPVEARVVRTGPGPAADALDRREAVSGQSVPGGYLLVLRELMARRTLEAQLFHTEKMRALAEMASSMAHRFNNLLATVVGRTELLLVSAQDGESRQHLEAILNTALDGAAAVRRLQEYARAHRKRDVDILDVAEVVASAVELARPRWHDVPLREGYRIDLTVSVEAGLRVQANFAELRDALLALLEYAIDSLPQGGSVSIIARPAAGGRVELLVQHSGRGIPPHLRSRLFDPLAWAPDLTGTGLALAAAHSIITRYGGSLLAQSPDSAGATFTITLPRA